MGIGIGLLQTFVLARLMPAAPFAEFILAGALGSALWLLDLGIAKILYVRLRAAWLGGTPEMPALAAQAGLIFGVDTVAVLLGGVLVWIGAGLHGTVAAPLDLAMFFAFGALNLPWFVLRNVAAASDGFLQFEVAEIARRLSQVAILPLPLLGVPLRVMLVLGLVSWIVPSLPMLALLARRSALRFSARASLLPDFVHDNRTDLGRSAAYAVCEYALYNHPYLVAAVIYRTPQATIFADLVLKLLRGTILLSASIAEAAVPEQTRAFHAGDRAALRHSFRRTVLRLLVPSGLLALGLLAGGPQLLSMLIANAAVVPPELTQIAAALVLVAAWQTASNHLLIHTGAFLRAARVALRSALGFLLLCLVIWLSPGTELRFWLGFLCVYLAGAAFYGRSALRRTAEVHP